MSCLIACAGQNIYAENDTQEVQRLDTIVIQATRTDRERLTTPASVYYLNQEQDNSMNVNLSETLKGVGVVMQGYTAAEKYELVKELISPHLNGLFMTPKDIDDTVKRIGFMISEALNILFSGRTCT